MEIMAGAASFATRPLSQSFDILEDEQRSEPGTHAARNSLTVLQELPVDHSRNQVASNHCVDVTLAATFQKLCIASPCKQNRSEARSHNQQQRCHIGQSENFEPLDAVEEEFSDITDNELTVLVNPPRNSTLQQKETRDIALQKHPLSLAVCGQPISEQIEKHLAGQFEWLISYAAPASSAEHHDTRSNATGANNGTVTFGCNLLSRQSKLLPGQTDAECPSNNVYTLIATPLQGDARVLPHFEAPVAVREGSGDGITSPSQAGALPLFSNTKHRAQCTMSPALTAVSEKTGVAFMNDSFSSCRIEDSLEELDKLEEELEAVNVVTRPSSLQPSEKPNAIAVQPQHTTAAKNTASKRVSIAEPSSTLRIKPIERTSATLRRSSSLTLRDKTSEGRRDVVEQKAAGSLTRSKSTNLRSVALQPTVKSTKPPTVPKFELPGEAVARRLREQREARQAQQAGTLKNNTTPNKPRFSKPLPKPTFELPGEAISRKKREEHEAKLRAQEEEDRKKREFKARPLRHTIGPSTLPRETIASLARQGKLPQQDDAKQPKRAPISSLKSTLGKAIGGESMAARGRNSMIVPVNDASRATSTSTGSMSGQKSNVSAEDAEKQRIRGRAIFTRDNSYTQQKERERADREAAAKRAREEAAERSRMASREWAEKKRRRQLALR